MESPKQWFIKTSAEGQFAFSTAGKVTPGLSRNRSSVKLREPDRLPTANSSHHNNHDMAVTSPFYERKLCKAKNCTCPYHRKKRFQEVRNVKRTGFSTTQPSPTQQIGNHSSAILTRISFRHSIKELADKENLLKFAKTVKFEGKAKVINQNEQFQRFLKQNYLILLKKVKYIEEDLHVIKKSVGEIFKFMYKNIDQPLDFIKEHLGQFVQDRNMTNLYMKRFEEIQRKRFGGLISKNTPENDKKSGFLTNKGGNQIKSQFRSLRGSVDGKSECASRASSKNQKLWTKLMIKDLENGYDIDELHLQKLGRESVDNFTANCQFLRNRLSLLDQQTLIEVKDNILERLRQELQKQEKQNPKNPTKREQIRLKKEELSKIMGIINAKIDYLQAVNDNNDYNDDESRGQQSMQARHSRMSKRNSNCSNMSMSSVRNGKNNNKSKFRPSKEPIHPEKEESEGRRSHNKSITIFNDDDDNIKLSAMNSDKARLEKYRRLSHDCFKTTRFLSESEGLSSAIREFRITSVDEIDDHLDMLTYYVYQNRKTSKELQIRIKGLNIENMVAKTTDSLLTVKRKARAFKKLLKQDLSTEIKDKIKDYVVLLDQKNFSKNRKWAFVKIKNMLLGHDNVELLDGEEQLSLASIMQGIIDELIPTSARLLFYNMKQSNFDQEEPNFEDNMFDYLKSTKKREDKKKKTLFLRKKTLHQLNKSRVQEKEQPQQREDTLMQTGFNDRCFSSSFGMNQIDQSFCDELQDSTSKPPLETTYMRLYQKLVNLP